MEYTYIVEVKNGNEYIRKQFKSMKFARKKYMEEEHAYLYKLHTKSGLLQFVDGK